MSSSLLLLSALVSCFLAVFVNGSLEMVHNFSQNENHQLTSSQLPLDPMRVIRDGGTKVNNDIVQLFVQSMNTSASMVTTGTSAAAAAGKPSSTLFENDHHRQLRRLRRDDNVKPDPNPMTDDEDATTNTSSSSSFSSDEVGWSNINEEVDMVIPMVLAHLQELGLAHLDLPDMQESLSVRPLFITYSAGLFLNNGLVYNLGGIQRNGNALMTYSDRSFVCRFYLLIKSLQFDYDFVLKLMAVVGYGKVNGSLDDTVIYADLSINVEDTRLRLNDFRIIKFRNIQVQLSQRRFIQELTGVILSPITNLFRDRITTSISDGLKEQMQGVMDDFNNKDPLELRTFAKQMLAGLTGQS
ncbi:uncharacterized protein LOC129913831 isoform X1 [Episyrphus balteatus]|uniref:uncharacterized protein LOC129913831 isoform X1 n=2 Tax=Episyrphus balteatus TaxID=286459 RepID=UPI00248678A9|nr:uncharacterized protein LOC129913831 isoform X1 [Episyrphus balteatus]